MKEGRTLTALSTLGSKRFESSVSQILLIEIYFFLIIFFSILHTEMIGQAGTAYITRFSSVITFSE